MKAYRGYAATIEYDEEDCVYHGRLADIADVITFEGDTPEEAERAFHDSVDDYLEWADSAGFAPDSPAFDRILLRLPAKLGLQISSAARESGEPVDTYLVKLLEGTVRKT